MKKISHKKAKKLKKKKSRRAALRGRKPASKKQHKALPKRKARSKKASKRPAKKTAAPKKRGGARRSLRNVATHATKAEKKKGAFEELVTRGKQRGFVTEDEIIHILPDIEQDLENLENLYEKLETSGIRIVGSEEMLKIETEEVKPEKKGGKKKDRMMDMGEGDDASDLVQMYLKEIGRVALLTGEEEVKLAKAIEKGDLVAKQRLTEANLRLVVSIA